MMSNQIEIINKETEIIFKNTIEIWGLKSTISKIKKKKSPGGPNSRFK